MIFIPPLAMIGSFVSATVWRRNAGSVRPWISTSLNSSQGPQKSMITAPSEMGNATGMLPSAGGVSGLETGLVLSVPLLAWTPPVPANHLPANRDGIPAVKPSAADLLNNSLRFIMSFHYFYDVFP